MLGANGGALADGSLNFKSSTFKGGRGQDGDTECFYNEDTQAVQCDNPVNLGPAKIIVESL